MDEKITYMTEKIIRDTTFIVEVAYSEDARQTAAEKVKKLLLDHADQLKS